MCYNIVTVKGSGTPNRTAEKGKRMEKVINKNGTEIEFETAVMLMDDEIRESLASEGFQTEQEFFAAYEKAHEEKYGEEWELSKENPCY